MRSPRERYTYFTARVKLASGAPLTLYPEPVLHEQLEAGDLVLVQFTAMGDHVPDFVELRKDLLHRLLAPQGIREIRPVRIKDADEFSKVSVRQGIFGAKGHRRVTFLPLLLFHFRLQGRRNLTLPPGGAMLLSEALGDEAPNGILEGIVKDVEVRHLSRLLQNVILKKLDVHNLRFLYGLRVLDLDA